MTRYSVAWAESARGDLEEIISYIAAEAPLNAAGVLDRLEARAGELAELPLRGRVVPELHWHGISSYRELLEPPWRIVYRVAKRQVVVLAVLDGRRRLDELLLTRLLRSQPG